MSLGLTRMNYIALRARDPEAAAEHAEKLGFSRAHTGGDGTEYLKAHGPDPYSLVYKPSDNGAGMDHASFLVEDLDAAASALEGKGIAIERVQGPEWEQPEALRFRTPAGHLMQMTTGLHLDGPVAHVAETPTSAPAPLAPDHVGLGAANFEIEEHFAAKKLGMLHSSRINAAGGPQIMSFMRAPGRWLYHQLVVVRHSNELHHLQFTLKSVDSFYETYEALKANGIAVEWGPLRHGPGHNIAMYFRDYEGNWIEYSVEEEVILDDATYVPRTWGSEDPHVVDEWGTGPPAPKELMGPPVEQAEKFAKLGGRMAQMAKTQLWVCLSRHGHGDDDTPPHPSAQIDDVLEHLEWALKLEAEGKIFAAGPFKNAQGGMQGDGLLIFRADSEEEAREMAASDPIHKGGFRDFELLKWELHEGQLDPSLGLLSTQEMNPS